PIMYKFTRIEMNKKITKKQKNNDIGASYRIVRFDKKNQRCMRYKRESLICNTKNECFICKKNNIPCIKKKEYINKRIYKDKKGMMYCKLLDDYWHTENLDLVYIHVNDIEELDGCCKDNEKGCFSEIGIYYANGSKQITEPLLGSLQSNNRAELYTVICAIETCENQDKVIKIKTDSRYVINAYFLITKRNGKIYFTHIFEHDDVIENEIADKLAKKVSNQINHITTLIAWLCTNNSGIDNLLEGWKPGDPVINSLPLSEVLEEQKKFGLEFTKILSTIDIWEIGREENDDENPKLLDRGTIFSFK
ncbi:28558_t:CDS:2, partial [Gigaspora margarita]